jgi:hypothetical protein
VIRAFASGWRESRAISSPPAVKTPGACFDSGADVEVPRHAPGSIVNPTAKTKSH